jgi:exopolysaccharide biosynthesis polyprenyl glycosylphosphotransferase
MAGFLPRTARVRPALTLLDAGAAALAFWLAHLVRFAPGDRSANWAQLLAHPLLFVLALASLWALATAAELYEPGVLRRGRETTSRVLFTAMAWGATLAVATYVVASWRFGRGLLLLTTLIWAALALVTRALAGLWLRRRVRPQVLVVGAPEAVAAACARLASHPFAPWQPVSGAGLAPTQVAAVAGRPGVELVVVTGSDAGVGEQALELAALQFSGVPIVVASEVWAFLDGRLPVAEISPAWFLHQAAFGAIHWELFNRLTRVLDIALSALMLAVTAPLLVLSALAVAIFSGLPVFYLQTRVGLFGRHFRVIKLRTMRPDAEAGGPAFEADADPRVTRVGRLLRRLRLDELPQLINVLKGDMSLVGPRPERPEFVAALAREIPYYSFRLAVPPGLTGWAQVNMPYARTDAEHRRKLEYDLYFIRERSLGIYLLTLLRTASAALVGVRR